jgi:hypothetical protein
MQRNCDVRPIGVGGIALKLLQSVAKPSGRIGEILRGHESKLLEQQVSR